MMTGLDLFIDNVVMVRKLKLRLYVLLVRSVGEDVIKLVFKVRVLSIIGSGQPWMA